MTNVAVDKIFRNTCAAGDRAALKTLCNKISDRTKCLDAIALFTDAAGLLRPLCRMLVEWKHDEDQGEHQPVYNEFSACLLLVLAMSHRFGLTTSELGLLEEDSIIRRLLERRDPQTQLQSLTPEQSKRLGGWIGGLFETEGISDELMSTCTPQELYEVIPALFQQMVRAGRLGILDQEKLKSGLGRELSLLYAPTQ